MSERKGLTKGEMVLPVIAAVAMTIAMIVSVPAMQRGDSPEAMANLAPGERPQEPPDYVKKLESYSGHGEWVKYTGEGGDEVFPGDAET